MASVAEKGIIEPLVVRQRGNRYQIIAGERRYHAAVQVGLREVPVVIREVDDAEVMEIALVENLQRKDLTAFEEAEALQQLAENCGHTHEDLARKLGKSRTSITESLSLTAMPEEVRNLCRLADISAKSTLLQLVRQANPQKMMALVQKLAGPAFRSSTQLQEEQEHSRTSFDSSKPSLKLVVRRVDRSTTPSFAPAARQLAARDTTDRHEIVDGQNRRKAELVSIRQTRSLKMRPPEALSTHMSNIS